MISSAQLYTLATALQTAYPARIVDRDWKDVDQQQEADLQAGLYSIVLDNARGLDSTRDLTGIDGRHKLIIVGQFVLAEGASGADVEDMELLMAQEIQDFTLNPPADWMGLSLNGIDTSLQQHTPFGWVICHLEHRDID